MPSYYVNINLNIIPIYGFTYTNMINRRMDMQNRQDILDNLILSCTEEIEYKDTNATSKNKTKCPVLFMYMGDYAVDNYELVKNVIDKNWRLNARYIYHIGMKSDDGKLYNLVDGSVLNDKTDDESVVLDEVFSEILMAPTGTFNEHNVIKIKFITSAADAGVEKYINTALGIKTTLTGLNLFKDMFVLLAQGGSHQERSATDVALKMLHEK